LHVSDIIIKLKDVERILNSADKRSGAIPCKTLNVRSNINLYSIRKQTDSQYNSLSRGVIWHDFGAQ